jgi:uncharacterized CHY-type Zn-finger protein
MDFLKLAKSIVRANEFCKQVEKECDLDKKVYLCAECKEPLTDHEVEEAINNRLNLKEVVCNDCWTDWMREKLNEEKHPDDPTKY